MNVKEHFSDPANAASWKAMFEPADEVVAHHELYNEVKAKRPDIAVQMPKLLFYICNFTVYGQPTEKDSQGNLGYRLHFRQHPEPSASEPAYD